MERGSTMNLRNGFEKLLLVLQFSFLSFFEKLLLVLGLLFLSCYVAARIDGVISSRAELKRFWEAREEQSSARPSASSGQDKSQPDFQLWSDKRIAAYKLSLSRSTPPALAVLEIPRMNLEVPVLEGTDDFTLDRAVGHIQGTPEPDQAGNVGIAGHRDGFFRGLKDIQPGDALELITGKASMRYLVDEILIVSPEDVSVLRPRKKDSLTLVTCYPFYFVGSAPKRFIVHASVADLTDNQLHLSSIGEAGGQPNH